MKVERGGEAAYVVTFEDEAELRHEEKTNLGVGGLFLRQADALPLLAVVELTLRLAGGRETRRQASVVAAMPAGLALHIEGPTADLVSSLLPAAIPPESAATPDPADADPGTLWERLRAMTPPQKILLAPKAERTTRALMLQDNDPMLLFALLKNPRLSLDEVVRIAKSSALGFQSAELILKTPQWSGNLDIRVALIHNPKLPLPIALRILPSLPDSEVRVIAKGGATSAALKQAALRRVIGGGS
jgi:hypothetical protein